MASLGDVRHAHLSSSNHCGGYIWRSAALNIFSSFIRRSALFCGLRHTEMRSVSCPTRSKISCSCISWYSESLAEFLPASQNTSSACEGAALALDWVFVGLAIVGDPMRMRGVMVAGMLAMVCRANLPLRPMGPRLAPALSLPAVLASNISALGSMRGYARAFSGWSTSSFTREVVWPGPGSSLSILQNSIKVRSSISKSRAELLSE
mmetsp:Transcript_29893/g.48275  ORF Transcript_29893/g.48275 Transcript_29893/m.48275 type:complete len:207 (-) Transcript_29893:943-1563(-)